jgi:hypothetical protein
MKSLNLDRAKIEPIIQEFFPQYIYQKDEKPSNLYVYKFSSASTKTASLNIYHNIDGTTTLMYKTGANQELSLQIAEKIKEGCSIEQINVDKFYLKAISEDDLKTVLEFIVDAGGEIIEEKEVERGLKFKIKGSQGDEITIHHYTNKALMIQGKPRKLFTDVIILLGELLPFKEVIEEQLKFYQVNLTSDGAIGVLENRMPEAGKYLDEKLKIILSPCLVFNKIDIELDDYAAFTFPALKGIEGVIKQIFRDHGVVIPKEGFGDFIENKAIEISLKGEAAKKIKNRKIVKVIGNLYSFYSTHRHTLFHVDGLISSTKILARGEALHLIETIINLIENSIQTLNEIETK